jgi:hypothetical protein
MKYLKLYESFIKLIKEEIKKLVVGKNPDSIGMGPDMEKFKLTIALQLGIPVKAWFIEF